MLALISLLMLLTVFILLLDWQVEAHTRGKLARGEEIGKLTPPRYRKASDLKSKAN